MKLCAKDTNLEGPVTAYACFAYCIREVFFRKIPEEAQN